MRQRVGLALALVGLVVTLGWGQGFQQGSGPSYYVRVYTSLIAKYLEARTPGDFARVKRDVEATLRQTGDMVVNEDDAHNIGTDDDFEPPFQHSDYSYKVTHSGWQLSWLLADLCLRTGDWKQLKRLATEQVAELDSPTPKPYTYTLYNGWPPPFAHLWLDAACRELDEGGWPAKLTPEAAGLLVGEAKELLLYGFTEWPVTTAHIKQVTATLLHIERELGPGFVARWWVEGASPETAGLDLYEIERPWDYIESVPLADGTWDMPLIEEASLVEVQRLARVSQLMVDQDVAGLQAVVRCEASLQFGRALARADIALRSGRKPHFNRLYVRAPDELLLAQYALRKLGSPVRVLANSYGELLGLPLEAEGHEYWPIKLTVLFCKYLGDWHFDSQTGHLSFQLEKRFGIPGTELQVEVWAGEVEARVNGKSVQLAAAPLLRDGELWITLVDTEPLFGGYLMWREDRGAVCGWALG